MRVDTTARRTIEALRAGVPSRSAVAELGTTQNDVEREFTNALEQVEGGYGAMPIAFSANFGDGKSHLLRYLKVQAEKLGFVTSLVVISPETPLGNSHVLLKAIAEQAEAPGRTGKAVMELAAPGSKAPRDAIAQLVRWAREAEIPDRFKAMLRVYDGIVDDEELRVQILGDLEGRPLIKSRLREALKRLGEASHFDLRGGPKNPLLAHDRIRLLAQFFRSHGTKGLVVFFDEVERIERFAFKARLSAYQELGWWKRICSQSGSNIFAVFACTSASVRQCLDDKGDEAKVRSGSSLLPEDRDQMAIEGMELLRMAQSSPLKGSTPDQFETLQHGVLSLYERAYDVSPAPLAIRRGRATVRSEIRRWITTWDLRRHYPAYNPTVETEEVKRDETEVPEGLTDEDGEPDLE